MKLTNSLGKRKRENTPAGEIMGFEDFAQEGRSFCGFGEDPLPAARNEDSKGLSLLLSFSRSLSPVCRGLDEVTKQRMSISCA
jgi:hypothetical protein